MTTPPSIPGSVVTVDPFRCRVWELTDRLGQYITEDTCKGEIASIRRDGQLVPALGRRLAGLLDVDIEIICGMRRLFVARHLRIPLRVELRDLTDREAAMAVDAENTLRRQTSPYERGLWLAKLLRQGLYDSQHHLASELGITPTQVTRLLKFVDLPSTIVDAFSSPHEILESWAVELHKACSDDHSRLLTDRSRMLQKQIPRPPAASVYEILMATRHRGRPRRNGSVGASHVVKSAAGTHLLRLEHQRKEVVLRIPNELVDAPTETAVTKALVAILSRQALADRTTGA